MSKHTPRPWQVNGSHIYGSDPERELVAMAHGNEGRMVANRDLIAAAPELLEALHTISTRLTKGPRHSTKKALELIAAVADAAIAKAEGKC